MLIGQIILLFLLLIITAIGFSLILMFVSSIASSIYGAPFVPMSRKLIRPLLEFGGLSGEDVFYDLGSGDGRVLISAAKEFGIKKAIGHEVTFWPYLESKFLVWRLGLNERIDVRRLNFFKAGLSKATFVYMYLFPKLVDRLAGKINAECNSGTRVLSPSFPIDITKHREFKLLKTQNFGKITAYLYEKI